MSGGNSLLWLNNAFGSPGDNMPSMMPAAIATAQAGTKPRASGPAVAGWSTSVNPAPSAAPTLSPQQAQPMARGLLGGYDEEPQGLFGALQQGMMNPMFLGGAALLSGEGMGGAFRGMQIGQGFQEDQRQRGLERQQKQEYQGLLGDPSVTGALPPAMLRIAQMAGPGQGPEFLAKYLDPARETDLAYKRALTQKAQREAANGGEQPSNVREWQYYQSLSPEQKQQYLTMKRAEKWLDTGTQFVSPSPGGGGGVPRTVDKNVAEKNRQEEVGKARGIAEASLPTVLNASQRMLATIDAVDQDPNLDKVTGFVGGRIPKHLQTEAMAETQSRVEQIQGQTFLQAYNDLRGAGQITEREGAAAQAAYNRLTTQTMGTKAYRAALKEFRGEVDKLVGIAKQKAGVSDNGNTLQSRGGGSFIQPGSMDLGSGFSLEFE